MQERHLEPEAAKTRTEEKKLAELGDGEPSPAPSRVGMLDCEMERAIVCHCGERYIDPNSRQHWYYSIHGASECTLQLPNKRCWCGLLRSEHKDGHAESGAAQEVSPPSPQTFAITGGECTKGEASGVASCRDPVTKASPEISSEGDTRELKAALRKLIKNSSHHDYDDARIVDAADLIEVERLLG